MSSQDDRARRVCSAVATNQKRIEEILDQKQRANDKALESAAARVGVDEEWLLRNLKRNALMAMRHRNRVAANRALELIGKHLGMFIERRSVALAAHDDADEYLAKLEALIAGEDVADDDGAAAHR